MPSSRDSMESAASEPVKKLTRKRSPSVGAATMASAQPSFLQLKPLTMERIASAFDAVGLEVGDDRTTVVTPNYVLTGTVGRFGDTPVLCLRYFMVRAHPLIGFGSLLSIANEISMTNLVVKGSVRVKEVAKTEEEGSNPAAPTSAFCAVTLEAEYPCGAGVADVQIYDLIALSTRLVEAMCQRFPLIAHPVAIPNTGS